MNFNWYRSFAEPAYIVAGRLSLQEILGTGHLVEDSTGHEQVPAIYDQVLGDFYFKK